MLLAQIDPKAAAEGLGANFLPWALVLTLVALAFVVRYAISQNTAHAAAVAAMHAEQLTAQRENAKEMRELLMQIVPLSTKLTEALEIVERLTNRNSREVQ